jgi:hydrogenase maturation protein HypF
LQELRLRKAREGKPFALMFQNLDRAKEYLYISDEEEDLMTGWRRPIVLLKSKGLLAPSVSIGLDTVGVMLPYMPFHYQLFDFLKLPAIVLTSGNISDEPVIIDDQEARKVLGKVADAVLTYNRKIHNRTDDSVVFHAGNHSRIIRRSRSYAPSPIPIDLNAEGIFAAGAELVNCFAMGKSDQAILSQHIGDLQNLETLAFYKESVERHRRLFRFKEELAVADLHPDYLSTRYVRELNLPTMTVQHHHAHIASCMAEHGLDEKVIGVSFDGTGLGTDGHVWGGEFLIADLIDFERAAHFEYIPQPGGDAATKHPWRMMLSYLHHYYGPDVAEHFPFLFRGIDRNEMALILNMLEQGLNSPLTSSTGRLFDAVSALAGICRNTTYHAEAPMRLEAAVQDQPAESYGFDAGDIISFRQTFDEMIHDLRKEVPAGQIASRFHQTIVSVILKKAEDIRAMTGIRKVVLSGGSFQNRILLASVEERLKGLGFKVYSHIRVPSNDGGIALGQLAVAAKRREQGLAGV